MDDRQIEIELMVDPASPGVAYIDMYVVYDKVGYKIPYSRWVKLGVMKYKVHSRRLLSKDNPTGRPRVHYYVNVADAMEWLNAIGRRKHVVFRLIGDIDETNDNDS